MFMARSEPHFRGKKWLYGDVEVKVTNSYKYLGMLFTTRLSLKTGWQEMNRKGRKGVVEILRCMKKLNSIESCLFWKLFDTQC